MSFSTLFSPASRWRRPVYKGMSLVHLCIKNCLDNALLNSNKNADFLRVFRDRIFPAWQLEPGLVCQGQFLETFNDYLASIGLTLYMFFFSLFTVSVSSTINCRAQLSKPNPKMVTYACHTWHAAGGRRGCRAAAAPDDTALCRPRRLPQMTCSVRRLWASRVRLAVLQGDEYKSAKATEVRWSMSRNKSKLKTLCDWQGPHDRTRRMKACSVCTVRQASNMSVVVLYCVRFTTVKYCA